MLSDVATGFDRYRRKIRKIKSDSCLTVIRGTDSLLDKLIASSGEELRFGKKAVGDFRLDV